MGLLEKIKGRKTRSQGQSDNLIVTSYLDTRGTTHSKNIGITSRGHLFPFQSTTLKKPLRAKVGKWFDGSEYFESVVGLDTNYIVLIDDVHYTVRRVDRKRGKVWLST